MTWRENLDQQARRLHQQIAATQRLVLDAGGSEEQLTQACAPYYQLLDRLYTEDLPLANAMDDSDLLLHLDGSGLQTVNPRLSLVAGVFGDVRKQVSTMIKTLAGAMHETLTLPKEIDLGLCSFARGSLYLGFSLPEPGENYKFLSGDPLVAASREALHTIGALTGDLDRMDAYEKVVHDFPDPLLRDAGLTAVVHLAPSGRRGIETVDLTGNCLPDKRWRHLTLDTRQRVKTWLDKPVLGTESVTLVGTVREIDLDARRIELRQIESNELTSLRGIYPAGYDRVAKSWIDHRVRLTGRVESFQGKPRLMQVAQLDVIG
ncbi:MAG: hypothetical protein B9S32_07650 [Verrucomicrobia bacterium Tous-C9LFEB]|nr:MAG: hypothetical protein B9S32_07650 [Verrucomicrobia bacterium Tous-C9LFEB]